MGELLQRARRRLITQLLVDQSALALTVGLGAVIALLVAGTQILDWYWPLLVAALSLGVGLWRLRGRIPSRYRLAQRIDRNLGLADSLSTAVFFAEHPQPGYEAVCAVQRREAERLAAGVDLEQALPRARSRYVLPAAVLLVAATGLFVARYGMTGRLDLRASLVDIVANKFFDSPVEPDAAWAGAMKPGPRSVDAAQPETAPSGEDPGQPLPPDAEKGSERNTDEGNAGSSERAGDTQPPGESRDAGNQEDSSDAAPQQRPGGPQGNRERENTGQAAPQEEPQRSMLDKLRDAVSNLMNRLNRDAGRQTAQNQGGQQKGQKQEPGGKQDGQSRSGEDDAQADSNQPGNQANSQEAKQSNTPGQKTSQEAASGAGDSEGKKDIEQAQALEAMGKLSELLGQRSMQVSGEWMVEVGNTQQQLRTTLTQQTAGHADSGGEVHRDQVPLGDQTYIERYFEQVRRTASAQRRGK